MVYVVASSNPLYDSLVDDLRKHFRDDDFVYITNSHRLTADYLKQLSPRYIFFPHWSMIIPQEIFANFECVIFHMTDVPFGRGGSPLQNLIIRGINKTKISAIRCEQGIDAGPVYCKRSLPLHGSAEDIFIRAKAIIEQMIIYMIKESPLPLEQVGQGTFFLRRTPEQSNIGEISDLGKVYDYIRMLDAPGYPHAFLETQHFRLEFQKALLEDGCLTAEVKIRKKE